MNAIHNEHTFQETQELFISISFNCFFSLSLKVHILYTKFSKSFQRSDLILQYLERTNTLAQIMSV